MKKWRADPTVFVEVLMPLHIQELPSQHDAQKSDLL